MPQRTSGAKLGLMDAIEIRKGQGQSARAATRNGGDAVPAN
jgi:hypothetical protein